MPTSSWEAAAVVAKRANRNATVTGKIAVVGTVAKFKIKKISV